MDAQADRTCSRCGKVFSKPCLLKRHENRKTPCSLIIDQKEAREIAPDKPHQCPYCNRRFAAQTHMRRHVRDVCKIAPNERNGELGMEKLLEHVTTQQKFIADQEARYNEQQERLLRLEAMIARTDEGAQNGGIRFRGDHATVNQVVLNFHGQENPRMVTKERVREALEAGGTTSDIVGAIMRAIYNEIPENRNAYLSNKKSSLAMVYEGTTPDDAKWVPKDTSEILPGMVTKSAGRLLDADWELLQELQEGSPAKAKKDKAAKELIHETFKGEVPTPGLLKSLAPIQRATLLANRPEKDE